MHHLSSNNHTPSHRGQGTVKLCPTPPYPINIHNRLYTRRRGMGGANITPIRTTILSNSNNPLLLMPHPLLTQLTVCKLSNAY